MQPARSGIIPCSPSSWSFKGSSTVQDRIGAPCFIIDSLTGLVSAVVKPPMAKVADVFGRLESFSLAVLLYVVGDVQMATSQSIQSYAAAQIFYSAGITGLQILQQIFLADTSDLLDRALWSSLPSLPVLATIWIGPVVASNVLRYASWRWGYAMWTIIVPIAFLPLATSLSINSRRAGRLGLIGRPPWEGLKISTFLRTIAVELDLVGLLLLSAALSLILMPLNLAANARDGWRNERILTMLIVGGLCAVSFVLWEINPRLARKPVLSMKLLRNRTVLAGCAIGFFYFSKIRSEGVKKGSR